MKPQIKYSVMGEAKTQCPKCGAWKPMKFDLCWKCWSQEPARITEGYASQKDYEESQEL